MNNMHQWMAVLSLAMKNSWRWRWRLSVISLLIALSICLHVLYSGTILSITASGIASTKPLDTMYFDALVQNESVAADISALPAPKYQRAIWANGETAMLYQVLTPFDSLELLGIAPKSSFFSFAEAELSGAFLQHASDLVLPQAVATRLGLHIGDILLVGNKLGTETRTLALNLVGIYSSKAQPAFALVHQTALCELGFDPTPNAYLVNYNRETSTLEHLVEWMETSYPQGIVISNILPKQMSTSILQERNQPWQGVSALIKSFAFIGMFTVAFMTFSERRTELAIYKTLGFSQSQIVASYVLEYAVPGTIGFICGNMLVAIFLTQLPWLNALAPADLGYSIGEANITMAMLLVISLLYPLILARVASVNQLLYTRVIPFYTHQMNHIEANFENILREYDENVRIVQLPMADGRLNGICTKTVGDMVKLGEVIGVEEQYGGLYIIETVCICDGRVISIDAYGIVTIKPTDPQAPFYPYSPALIDATRRRVNAFSKGREGARKP